MNRRPLPLFSLLILFFIFSCSTEKQPVYKKSKALMDTFVTITVVSDSEEKAARAMESAFSAVERFGNLIDFFSDKSELALINRNAGVREIKVSPETLDVIEKAVYVSERSGGAFDPTIGPVIRQWDFHKNVRPSEEVIRKNLRLVNYKNIVIDRDRSTVFLREKGMLLDLGGIAKGYAADLSVAALRQNGIRAGIVATAGDIRTFGSKPDGRPWNIGIKNPRRKNEADEIIAEIKLGNKAISTSGDYERYFISGGRRFHHILDPLTGCPAGGCMSVSIIADKGVFTDAFSTAVFVLGTEKGLRFIEGAGMDAIIIDNNGKIHTTQGIKGDLKIEEGH